MIFLQLFIKLFCICNIFVSPAIGQREHKNSKKEQKQCMSTYSFTVLDANNMKCSHHKPDQNTPADGAISTSDGAVTRRLLATVQKLIQHTNYLNRAKSAEKMVEKLESDMARQEVEVQVLLERMTTLQNQIHLLTSGRRDENVEDTVFTGYSSVTNQYLGCPKHHSRRVHEMAPIQYNSDQVIRLVPRSCFEWRFNGYTQTGLYLIDPDGVDGLSPFTVECDMLAPEGAVTVIHHNYEGRTHVTGHEEAGSLQIVVTYPGVSVEHQSLLVDSSQYCEQYLNWECRGASLTKNTWWVGRDGHRAKYWAGGQPSGGCHCASYDGCIGDNLCNCDVNDDTRWLQDGGNITDEAVLPVSQLYIGDTGGPNEEGYYTLGPLRCFSNLQNPVGDNNAFLPVRVHPPFDVFCDYDGWLLIQRRYINGQVNFNRSWLEYKQGFGDLTAEHWLGFEKIYQLLSQSQPYTLSVSLDVGKGIKYIAQYDNFTIGSEENNYSLQVGQYNGTAGDLLTASNGASFSTHDQDNDINADINCAGTMQGGWWFTECINGNPNSFPIAWLGLRPIQEVEMKLKPSSFI